MPRPTVAHIDIEALVHNVGAIRNFIGGRKICAVVKADAYGHGAAVAATALKSAGADMFGVAMTEEAVELRDCGIQEPVILLTSVPTDDIDVLLEQSIIPSLSDEGFAKELSKRAVEKDMVAPVHVNVDTGMRRVGFPYQEAVDAVKRIARLPGIRLAGMFTHFSCSDAEDLSFSRRQIDRLKSVVGPLRNAGVEVPFVHMANSCGVLRLPEAYFDGVRPGLILYGLYPNTSLRNVLDLKPALSMRTKIAHCKRVPAGKKLGYGHTFTTWRDSTIAVLPVGYHDGFIRGYSNAAEVLINGQRAPVVGRVCMDQTLVDVTDVPDVQPGDEAVIYGQQGERSIRVEENAELIGGIPYELTCAIGSRVRRQFVMNGSVLAEAPMRSSAPESILQKIDHHLSKPLDESSPGKSDQLGAA